MTYRTIRTITAGLMATLALAAGAQANPLTQPSANEVKKAQKQLAALTVAPASHQDTYDRDLFPHWRSAGGGCDAREAELKRAGTGVTSVASTCKITGGRWVDPYGGETFTNPRQLDIDHVVPLGNAWRSGAWKWSKDRRATYANDPAVLLAVSASLNRQKSDDGPEQWRPPKKSIWKAYATRWVNIKSTYKLSVTGNERWWLRQMLAGTAK